ncbi:ead/Ea22-like family protein [Citrobacter braakii]|uniref:ead/Ea22-like family protein n=1 Tax=Citrobacter TaxID=544 RepID=UPI0015EAE285|nr:MULTISPECIES: ead/Ea22-like family protein [Citrobacter]MBM3061488.1 ead/Ea22-like family protein [Citrobacter braakii]MBM3068984.1 ead/Ea22-like family protein [Citrobacter braakii]QLS53988.1 ead/Ea22-like family protein [Citrobacter sp. RHBSTW-00887]QLS55400.1 ead/Ea22-like family protein [Citrobacter sp. RHBSTW-00887]
MSNIDKQALRERYSLQPVPKCHICDAVMTIARASAGAVMYACSGCTYDDNGAHYAPGRSPGDAHYSASRVTIFESGDSDVLALLDELESTEKRNTELQIENAYIRNRHKELDLLIGKNILVMQAAIIEWQATGNATTALAWIYNTLWGPGELPSEDEKDAQAYFDREYAPIDEELMALHKWFWEQSEAERAAVGIGVKGE